MTVAILRTEAGRNPHDRALSDLVGELATRSDAFRSRWAKHDVRLHHSGTKLFRHPVARELTVDFNAVPLPGRPWAVAHRLHGRTGLPQRREARTARQWGCYLPPARRQHQRRLKPGGSVLGPRACLL